MQQQFRRANIAASPQFDIPLTPPPYPCSTERRTKVAREWPVRMLETGVVAGSLGALVILTHVIAEVILPTPDLALGQHEAPAISFSEVDMPGPSLRSTPDDETEGDEVSIPADSSDIQQLSPRTVPSAAPMTSRQTPGAATIVPAPEIGTAAEGLAQTTQTDLSVVAIVLDNVAAILARTEVSVEERGFVHLSEQYDDILQDDLDANGGPRASQHAFDTSSSVPTPVQEELGELLLHEAPEMVLTESEPEFFHEHHAAGEGIAPEFQLADYSRLTPLFNVEPGASPLSLAGHSGDLRADLSLQRLQLELDTQLRPLADEPVVTRLPAAQLGTGYTSFSRPSVFESELTEHGDHISALEVAPIQRSTQVAQSDPDIMPSFIPSAAPAASSSIPDPVAGIARQSPVHQSARVDETSAVTEAVAPVVFGKIVIGNGSLPFSPTSIMSRRSGTSDQGVLTGVFSTRVSQWALLTMRDGRVLRLETGDRIGRARTVSVEANGIMLDIDGARSFLRVGMELPEL